MIATTSMSTGGFGKGRPSEFGEAMIGHQVVLPDEWWSELNTRAHQKAALQAKKTGRKPKKVSASEIIRDLITPVMKGDFIKANVQLTGYIMGSKAQEVRPFSQKGRAPVLEVPFLDAVNGDDYYALSVIGNALDHEGGQRVPDGHYIIMRKDTVGIHGAIVEVEWQDEKGKPVSSLKRYQPTATGSAVFAPLFKGEKPIEKAAGAFQIVGVMVRAWDGSSEQ